MQSVATVKMACELQNQSSASGKSQLFFSLLLSFWCLLFGFLLWLAAPPSSTTHCFLKSLHPRITSSLYQTTYANCSECSFRLVVAIHVPTDTPSAVPTPPLSHTLAHCSTQYCNNNSKKSSLRKIGKAVSGCGTAVLCTLTATYV